LEKPVIIRRAKEEDLSEVHRIEVLSFKYPYTYSYLKALYLLSPNLFYVAEVDGKVIGYVVGLIELGSIGHIISIAVHPGWRRKGIGSKLLKKIEDEFKRKGIKSFILEVEITNKPAISLYKKHGYRVIDVIKGYYPGGEDAYVMVKEDA